MRERFDLMEKRGQTLIVFITTVAVFIITVSVKQGVAIKITLSLVLAFLLYAVSMGFATLAQVYGSCIIPDPRLLRQHSLRWDDWTFKNNLIDYAGKHFEQNMNTVNARMQMIVGTLVFGLLSLLALLLWSAGS